MDVSEIKLRRLFGQHLLEPSDAGTVLHDLCGIQAQYLAHAFHALRIRCAEFDEKHPAGIAKNWTIRGTMHIFREEDTPLMLHCGRRNVLRPCDTMEEDEYITKERKQYFAEKILEGVSGGGGDREALKRLCFYAGMTDEEAKSVFNPWGGTLRALCEQGKLTHVISQKKAFTACKPFIPMQKDAAELELARRYFEHYGPASVRDAAYFFNVPQTEVKRWIAQLELNECTCGDKTYYDTKETKQPEKEIPGCIFLAGFDPLMLGYEKKDNPFLPQEHLRGIFSAGGMVMPALLVRGRVIGRWKKTGKRLAITLFENIFAQDICAIRDAAERLWPDLNRIEGLQ